MPKKDKGVKVATLLPHFSDSFVQWCEDTCRFLKTDSTDKDVLYFRSNIADLLTNIANQYITQVSKQVILSELSILPLILNLSIGLRTHIALLMRDIFPAYEDLHLEDILANHEKELNNIFINLYYNHSEHCIVIIVDKYHLSEDKYLSYNLSILNNVDYICNH